MSITENIAAIRAKMDAAAIAAGRDPKDILLCAATKMNGTANVRQAIAGGIDLCGENKVQELTQKLSENAYEGVPIHFIGHLQTNKVKQVVGKVDMIQSVDSGRLLAAIEREAARQGIRQDILLEVNIGNEESKSGFTPAEIPALAEHFADFPHLRLRGLMSIPPICQKNGDNDKFFQEMLKLSVDITAKKSDNVCIDTLSMGMSDDFEAAICFGSTMVRVGTAIFGRRDYSNPYQTGLVNTGGKQHELLG